MMKFSTGQQALSATIDHLVVAGWTGRDPQAIRHHIDELAALGVSPPSSVPLYYRVSNDLLTTSTRIQVAGPDTSGEAEPLILRLDGALYLGLASDHTDRKLEAHSVALSKQVCVKPCASELWAWDSVAHHLDQIELRSEILESGTWIAYQSGTLAAMRPLAELLAGAETATDHAPGTLAMLGGTLPVLSGGVRPAKAFRATLHDTVTGRTIPLAYEVETLPLVS